MTNPNQQVKRSRRLPAHSPFASLRENAALSGSCLPSAPLRENQALETDSPSGAAQRRISHLKQKEKAES